MAERVKRSCSEIEISPLASPHELKLLTSHASNCKIVYYNDLLIESLLDKGQFGAVYKGIWQDVSIAIKELDDSTDAKEFAEEVWLMSQLDHPNIVKFVGACNAPKFCIIMEFIEGGSLYKFLHVEKKQLDTDVMTSLLCDIAKGLSYLHEQKVLHRDLKSKNVLLTSCKAPISAKLCDFGVAKLQARDKPQSNDVGTLLWMSPEVMRTRCHSMSSDVYSYGVVMYEMLTNSLPFSDRKELNHFNIMYLLCIEAKQLALPPALALRTPSQLKYVLDRCLDHSVDMRPTANEISELLETADWEDAFSSVGDSSDDQITFEN